MKRAVAGVMCFLILLSFSFPVHAENSVDISISVGEVKNNRLFDMVGYAVSDDMICAGEFEIIYDSKVVEYRSIKSDVFSVSAKEENGKITVVFANGDGIDLSKNTELFVITFKSISQGAFDLGLNNVRCLNSKFEDLKIAFEDCEISVSQNVVTAKGKSARNTSKFAQEKSAITKIEDSKEEKATSDSLFISGQSNGAKAVFYGAVAVFAVVALFVAGVVCGRHFSERKNKQKAEKRE